MIFTNLTGQISDIYRQVDYVESMSDVFERLIVRRIPSCINNKVWFKKLGSIPGRGRYLRQVSLRQLPMLTQH